ncbi:Yip1 family protein [Sphingomonas sp.]|uniref:Yip1 family protein n=1 Tax=Sphingomonas sp. TaxID=28214 RepID=UPI0025D74D14|nr:Yip1 family protein [Sphingomonas sp.]
MSDIGPPPVGRQNALVDRAKAILLTPKTEWPVIDAESITVAEIFKSYVLPLAAIGPVAQLVGSTVFGYGVVGFSYRPTLAAAIGTAIVGYVFALIGVYLLALIIDYLAPQFGAAKNRTQAFKLAAYASTAAWVTGIFGLLPALTFLALLGGIYSLYLLYLGLPVLMKVTAEKLVPYFAVIIVVAIVIRLVLLALTVPLIGTFAMAGGASAVDTASGTVTIPGGGSVDLDRMQAASKRMEASAAAMQNGQAKPPTAPALLQALLPATLPGGFTRTSLESASAGSGGLGGSNAKGEYTSGDQIVRLEVTDMGALGGLAALGGAMNIESTKQSASGYEKTGKVDGRLTTEKWDAAGKSGTYNTIVADRFMVEASGTAPSIDVFKSAVAAINIAQIEALAKQ